MTSGDPFRRVVSGEPFRPTAKAWNAAIEAGEKSRRVDQSGNLRLKRVRPNTGVLLVKNATADTTFVAGDVIEINPIFPRDLTAIEFPYTHEINTDETRLLSSGRLTSGGYTENVIGVCREAIRPREYGAVQVDGYCYARVNGAVATVSQGAALALEWDAARYARAFRPAMVPIGHAVLAWSISSSRSGRWPVLLTPRASSHHPVIEVGLTQVGGGPGDASNPATWTYDVTVQNDITQTILSGVDIAASPHSYRRPTRGPIGAATRGLARVDLLAFDPPTTPGLDVIVANEQIQY